MQLKTLNLLSPFSILVVEDDEIARATIKQDIKPYCKCFYEASDGLKGLEIFKEHQIDIIVTDIHMPQINGFDMIEKILALKPKQLFIIMTSYDTDENLIQSMKDGACSFLRKPLNIEELQTALVISLGKLKCTTRNLNENLHVDCQKEIIYLRKKPMFLSYKCNKIFWLLYHNINRLVSYEMLEDYVYDNEAVNKSTIHNAILRIKKQLENINIENIANEGYILKTNK